MKRETLLAVAVALAFGASLSSAQTFLCRTPSDLSMTECTPTSSSDLRASMGEPVVTHDRPAPRPPQGISAVPSGPHTTITTYRDGGAWPETEPSVSRYHYYYGPWIYYYER